MSRSSGEVEQELVSSFVEAYPRYVDALLEERDLPSPPEVAKSIARGAVWLRSELTALVSTDPRLQRRSPLEVFQEALSFPTAALTVLGVSRPRRDEVTVAALPGDVYDLAPASSQQLGERAWRAHLSWGSPRPARLAGGRPPSISSRAAVPVAVLFGVDLMDRTRIQVVVTGAGYQFEVWRNPAAVTAGLARRRPAVVFVDLNHTSAYDAIRQISAAGVRSIAYGPHVDDFAMAAAGALGASEVLPRSRFFRRLPELLPSVT